MTERFTDSSIKALAAPAKGSKIYWDGGLPGFGCRVTSAGARAWILNYRSKKDVDRQMTIGDAGRWEDGKWRPGAWNASRARAEAERLRRLVDAGGDPLWDRREQREAPTVNQLADRFEEEHLVRKRPGTQDEYKRLIKSYIRPQLGTKKVADIRHADIDRLHGTISKKAPYSANRCVAVLSKMFNLSIKWEMRQTNPAIGIERSPEEKRKRYLSTVEISRLSEALAGSDERQSANAVRLLLLTGARKGETLAAKWSDFNLSEGVWTKPGATTKTATDHRIPLSAPALALLTEIKTHADKDNERRLREKLPPIDFVFPSRDAAGKVVALKDLKTFWATIRRKAGITDARIHDLRHTYASVLASSGLSLPIIGALLGHTQAQTTARYAHLLDDPLRKATETAGAIISGKPVAAVQDIKEGRRA